MSQSLKPTEDLRRFNELMNLADYVAERDPRGASLLRWAAHQLANCKCLRCNLSYGRGYTAGYKAGVKEWETSVR